MACNNNPICLAHIARPQRSFCQHDMKMGLLQIMHVNPFAGLDNEDSYAHLTKFYKISRMIGALETEEETVFLRLFPQSLMGKENEC